MFASRRDTTGCASPAVRLAKGCRWRRVRLLPVRIAGFSVEADGSAMYTLQSLWTQAREGLDVTTVIFDNRSYAILNFELKRLGTQVRASSKCSSSNAPTIGLRIDGGGGGYAGGT